MRIILATNTSKTTVKKSDGKYQINGIPITVDNSIMNNIKYPADENAKGMKTLNGMPMTLTHPADNDGRNVSVFSPDGIDFYSGGKITNTYNKDGVWYADSDIDEKKLRASDMGEYFANRLDSGEPIGVSTGLTFEANNESGDGYKMIARNMSFDHLAMLHESEKPAGGDATVMRFNGEDVQAFNFDDIKPVKEESTESIITRTLNAFAKKFSMGYNNTDLTNQDGERDMRNLIEAKLKAAGIEVNGLDEDALLLAYNELQAPKEPAKEPQTNSEETPAWAKDLVAKVNSLETQLAANADKELNEVAEQVAALNKGLDAEDAKALGLTKAKAFLAANGAEFVAEGYNAQHSGRNVNINSSEDEYRSRKPGLEE
tara:strand:+ start:348 stop:1466 length:1119 start_codon:yes stop_codon:yes gene_type:complete